MTWYDEVFKIAFEDLDKEKAGKKWMDQLEAAERKQREKARERKLEDKKLGLLD